MPLVPKVQQKQTIALIDSANLAFRFAHSFRGQTITTSSGVDVSTGVIFGMFDTVWKLTDIYKLDQVFFVLEGPHDTNPRRSHPAYKSKRATSFSVDITSEMLLLRGLAPKLGIPVVVPVIGEADDGIAFLTRKLRSQSNEILICSGDHDMQVMLNKNIKIVKSASKTGESSKSRTQEDFQTEFGFHPKYFSLFMAVTGDSSDCIPGIKGIGPKKGMAVFSNILAAGLKLSPETISAELIKTYPSIVSGSSAEYLSGLIKEYYSLTFIRNTWPIDVAVPQAPNISKIKEAFETLKMRNFLRDINSIYSKCRHFYSKWDAINSELARVGN